MEKIYLEYRSKEKTFYDFSDTLFLSNSSIKHLYMLQDTVDNLLFFFFFNIALGAIEETVVLREPVSLLLQEILSGRTIIVG